MQDEPMNPTPRMVRSHNERMIGGVAGGLAAYLNVDPLLVRLGFLVLALLNGIGAVVYVVLWFLVPAEHTTATDARAHVQENIAEIQQTVQQAISTTTIWVQSLFKQA